jgi:hypothetical protein
MRGFHPPCSCYCDGPPSMQSSCYLLPAGCLLDLFTLKMEAVSSSEKMVNFYHTKWHDITENGIFH